MLLQHPTWLKCMILIYCKQIVSNFQEELLFRIDTY